MVQGCVGPQRNTGFVLVTLTDVVKSPVFRCRQTWFKSYLCHLLAVSSSIKGDKILAFQRLLGEFKDSTLVLPRVWHTMCTT